MTCRSDARGRHPTHRGGVPVTEQSPAAKLRARAESYSRDAQVFHDEGATYDAVAYRTIATELRKVADELDAVSR